MFNSVVLDVVIGLLFIYLLYSLLASIISEIVATALSLRARNLREAMDRMLRDEKPSKFGRRLWDSVNLLKSPMNQIVNAFYNHPEIKYMGSSGVFASPSNFKASSFSKAIIELLAGKDPVNREYLENILTREEISIGVKKDKEKLSVIKKITVFIERIKLRWKGSFQKSVEADQEQQKPLDPETAKYIRSLWQESQGDIEKFKLLLEGWFEKTMVHTLEWYKRKIRSVTFVIGFLLAWFFYADTFVIVKTLSTDKVARDQMVSMATAYVQNNQINLDTSNIADKTQVTDLNRKLDSLLVVKNQLQEDINKANNILGFGGWPPDSVSVKIDSKKGTKSYTPYIDDKSLSKAMTDKKDLIKFSFWDKVSYLFRLLYHHFFGFLMTAIAISLGAPFWFDMLNKIMKLRTSGKEEINNPDEPAKSTTVSPLNRVG